MVSALRQAAFNGAVYTFSSTDASVVAQLLGKNAAGLAISQVVPIPNGPRVKVVAEYLQALKAWGQGTPGPLGLEAFIEAKVLVEGLKRAGTNPTTSSLVKGLESLRDHDLGGFFINYSPTAHTGSTFVEINVVNANGELIR
jgi:branched-chain amino acid transport system substrate-binding protein